MDQKNNSSRDETRGINEIFGSGCGTGPDELLKHEDLFDKAMAMTSRMGLEGEEVNRRLVFLSAVGGHLGEPIHLIVHGDSSAGKNTLVNRVLDLLPEERCLRVSGLSKRALEYRGDRIEGVLFIDEADGLIEAEYALRQAMSEGRVRRLTVDVNTQKAKQLEVEVDASIITTTTAPAVHTENQTRVFDIWMDESEKQTKGVLQRLAQEAAGETKSVDDEELKLWREALAGLESLKVTVPFAPRLASSFPSSKLRARRDFGRVLSLVQACALLHQRQRETDQEGRLVASVEDYEVILPLVQAVLGQSMTGLTDTALELIDLHDDLSGNDPNSWVQRANLEREAHARGIASKNTVHKWAKRLAGSLGIWEGRKYQGAWQHRKVRDPRQQPLGLPEADALRSDSETTSSTSSSTGGGGRRKVSADRVVEASPTPSSEDGVRSQETEEEGEGSTPGIGTPPVHKLPLGEDGWEEARHPYETGDNASHLPQTEKEENSGGDAGTTTGSSNPTASDTAETERGATEYDGPPLPFWTSVSAFWSNEEVA